MFYADIHGRTFWCSPRDFHGRRPTPVQQDRVAFFSLAMVPLFCKTFNTGLNSWVRRVNCYHYLSMQISFSSSAAFWSPLARVCNEGKEAVRSSGTLVNVSAQEARCVLLQHQIVLPPAGSNLNVKHISWDVKHEVLSEVMACDIGWHPGAPDSPTSPRHGVQKRCILKYAICIRMTGCDRTNED